MFDCLNYDLYQSLQVAPPSRFWMISSPLRSPIWIGLPVETHFRGYARDSRRSYIDGVSAKATATHFQRDRGHHGYFPQLQGKGIHSQWVNGCKTFLSSEPYPGGAQAG